MAPHASWRVLVRLVPAVAVLAIAGVSGQSGARNGEWRTYGGDRGNTRYSPLDQIDASNFSTLEVAWRFKTDNLGPQPEFNLQSTPLVVGGRLYTTAGSRRSVVSLDALTGELLWVHRIDEGGGGAAAPRRPPAWGAKSAPIPSSDWRTCPSSCRPATSTAATGPATTCSVRASSPSISIP